MPFVMTTLLGIGPRPARSWLDSLFGAAYAQELASGGTGRRGATRPTVASSSSCRCRPPRCAHMVSALHREALAHAASAASMAATVAATAPTAAAAAPAAADPARPRTTVVHCHNTPPHSDTYDIYIGGGIGATHQRWGLDCPWRSPFAVAGINWIRPDAPDLRLTARGFQRDSN